MLFQNKICAPHWYNWSASPFHEFRTPIYRIDYVNVKVPFSKVITRLPRVLRMIFRMNKHFIFFTHEKLTHFF